MTIFSELVISIVSDLHQAGFIKDADELQHLANAVLYQTLSPGVRRDALKKRDALPRKVAWRFVSAAFGAKRVAGKT